MNASNSDVANFFMIYECGVTKLSLMPQISTLWHDKCLMWQMLNCGWNRLECTKSAAATQLVERPHNATKDVDLYVRRGFMWQKASFAIIKCAYILTAVNTLHAYPAHGKVRKKIALAVADFANFVLSLFVCSLLWVFVTIFQRRLILCCLDSEKWWWLLDHFGDCVVRTSSGDYQVILEGVRWETLSGWRG